MLAFSWHWQRERDEAAGATAQRLGASLCAGIGGTAASADVEGAAFAYRPLRAARGFARAWHPAVSPSGAVVLFHGHLANAAEISRTLGADSTEPAAVYGLATARWGEDADRRLIGEYCAVVFDAVRKTARLSRSPLRAPPLHYFVGEAHLVAASVPRAIFATGVQMKLDERRVADSNWLNFGDETASWYIGLARLPLGGIVEIGPAGSRLRRYYDVLALPEVRLGSVEEYVARADELLDEAVRVSLDGARLPGVSLSGGLDSPQVAARALTMLPPGQALPSFTFAPEPGWDGIVPPGVIGDESALVREFATLHPGLEPHFTTNRGIEHDHRWPEMFHAMGVAPSGLCNMYVFHGIFAEAKRRGCDRLLLAEWGNLTFSEKGDWAFVEYFLKGRWRELYRALRNRPDDPRSLLRRFVAMSLVPLLPDPAWLMLMRLWHPARRASLELISPLDPDFRRAMDVEGRARRGGVSFDRYQPRSRREAIRKLFSNADAEAADIYQGFEQLYGVEQRDPTAYRPLVEFCLGLPTELFVRDGEQRWLGKRLAAGMMPAEQRANRRNGRWDADWHLRIGRRRGDWLRELDRAARNPRLARMLDLPRLRRALEDFPQTTVIDPQEWMPIEMAAPRGLLTARFVNFVEGRNDD